MKIGGLGAGKPQFPAQHFVFQPDFFYGANLLRLSETTNNLPPHPETARRAIAAWHGKVDFDAELATRAGTELIVNHQSGILEGNFFLYRNLIDCRHEDHGGASTACRFIK